MNGSHTSPASCCTGELPGERQGADRHDRTDEEERGERRPDPLRPLVLEHQREEGPTDARGGPGHPATAPAAAALREVIRTSMVVSEVATVTRMRTATATEMTRVDRRATAATPSGVEASRASSAQPSSRQAMSSGARASWTTGRVKLVTRTDPGMSRVPRR